jgi:urate oxidase
MPRLAATHHGETRVRLLRVVRRGDRHDAHDLTVTVRFDGGLAHALSDATRGNVVPAGTLTALVHRTAREHATGEIEPFALALAARLLETQPSAARVRVDVSEQPWVRVDVGGKAQGRAFTRGSAERRTAAVTTNGEQTAVVSGLDDLVLMRTAGLLQGRGVDRADDGSEDAVPALVVASLSARWTHRAGDVPFGASRIAVRNAIVETFAVHAARSLPHTLQAIGDVVLTASDDLLDVTLTLHERPCRPADVFGLDAATDDLFIPGDEPLGTIEVTVERDPVP